MAHITIIKYKTKGLTETAKRMAANVCDSLKTYGNVNIQKYLDSTGPGEWRWRVICELVTEKCYNKIEERLTKEFPLFEESLRSLCMTLGESADYIDRNNVDVEEVKKLKESDICSQHSSLDPDIYSLFGMLMSSMAGNCNQNLLKYLMNPFESWTLTGIKERGSLTAYRNLTRRIEKIFSKELESLNGEIPDDFEYLILYWLEQVNSKIAVADAEDKEITEAATLLDKATRKGVEALFDKMEKGGNPIILDIEKGTTADVSEVTEIDDFEVPDFEPEPEVEKEIQPKVKVTPYKLSGVCEVFIPLPNGVVGGKLSEVMPGNGEIVKTVVVNWADRKIAEIYIGQAIPRNKAEVFYSYSLAKNVFDAKLMTGANEAMDMLSSFFRQCDDTGEMRLIRDRMEKMIEDI